MSVKLKNTPSFFKVLSKMDFNRLLRLPPAFFEKYGLVLPEKVELRISSEKTWPVKVEQMRNGPFCFTQGWGIFAQDVGLKLGEFLVFMFNGESIFYVLVFDTSACQRELPVSSFQLENSDSDEDDVESMDGECEIKNQRARNAINERSKARNDGSASKLNQSTEEDNPLYFEILLRAYHRSKICLTKRFCTAAGLIGKRNVGLEYESKHGYHSVVLNHQVAGYRTDMGRGWPEFRKENGLVYGKRYSFEFKPSKNVVRVEEIKKGN